MEYYGSGQCGTGYVISSAARRSRAGSFGRHKRGQRGNTKYFPVRRTHAGADESERYRNTYISVHCSGSLVRRARSGLAGWPSNSNGEPRVMTVDTRPLAGAESKEADLGQLGKALGASAECPHRRAGRDNLRPVT